MKKIVFVVQLALAFCFGSCGTASSEKSTSNKDVATFDSLISAFQDEQILDVRTPSEFAEGYLKNAQNINWNGPDFAINVGSLDKSKPVMVYCRSGRRSAEAAKYLRDNGFTSVYELEGGIEGWQAAGKSVEKAAVTASNDGPVSLDQFNALIKNNKVVLVDFTATWCGPCKILAPSLHELETELAGKFVLVKVDVDRDRPVAEFMNIAAMPTLVLYKDGQIQWRNEGLVPKDMVAEKINGVQ